MQLLGKTAAAPAVINQKSVRVLEKIRSGKIDVEMNAVGVMLIITLGVVYAIASYVGMKTFKGCGAVNEQERYKTLHRLLSHTLAISLTIPATLLIGKMFKNDVSASWSCSASSAFSAPPSPSISRASAKTRLNRKRRRRSVPFFASF